VHTQLPVAVHVFLFRSDRVLLLRRANTGYADGQWSVPAGHLEGNETVTQGARRELVEEVGVSLPAERLAFAGVMHRTERGGRIDFFLRAELRATDSQPSNREPHKCSELAWTDPKALPPDVIPYIRAALAQLADGIAFAEGDFAS
jgi:ADP-ribose pyrophosphatase YjhB (NUDIX family)